MSKYKIIIYLKLNSRFLYLPVATKLNTYVCKLGRILVVFSKRDKTKSEILCKGLIIKQPDYSNIILQQIFWIRTTIKSRMKSCRRNNNDKNHNRFSLTNSPNISLAIRPISKKSNSSYSRIIENDHRGSLTAAPCTCAKFSRAYAK